MSEGEAGRELAGGEARELPLFYREPQLLSSHVQGDWRLRDGDAGFAATAGFVPIVANELAAAARCYPTVFAGDSATPLAVLGLERVNLFVTDGEWERQAYVPAYVRRYPFALVKLGEPPQLALTIDAGSERVVKAGEAPAGAVALFEDGQPSSLTQQALEFCDAFQREAEATEAFTRALQQHDLLIDRRADATLPDGRKFGLEGFKIVDADKFRQLDAATVVEWHAKGWLALVHFHLASLERFRDLLDRQTGRIVTTRSFQDGKGESAEPSAGEQALH